MKFIYQGIQIIAVNIHKGAFKVFNEYSFLNLSDFAFFWELLLNGKKVKNGYFKLIGEPLSYTDFTIALPKVKYGKNDELLLNLFCTGRKSLTLKETAQVSSQQFVLNKAQFPKASVFPVLTKDSKARSFQSKTASFSFSEDGLLETLKVKGVDLLLNPVAMNFWRAPVDNDIGNEMPIKSNVWRCAFDNRKLVELRSKTSKNSLAIQSKFKLLDLPATVEIQSLVDQSGTLCLFFSLDLTRKNLPELPRFGSRLKLSKEYSQVEYYGRGPWENYPDRNSSSLLGLYKDTIENQYFPYPRPQENGYKTDLRWLKLTGDKAPALMVNGQQPFCFSALYHDQEDFDMGLSKAQRHTNDIVKRRHVDLHLDLTQRGLGGDDSWGRLPHDQYRLLDTHYSFSYSLSLF